jgi:hypothetical protein
VRGCPDVRTFRVWRQPHDSGTTWPVFVIWTVIANQDCSGGRFSHGGRPCPEPQVQYGVGLMAVIGVGVLALGALWWWGVTRRYGTERKALPQVWLLLIGWLLLAIGAVVALFVLGDRPATSAPSTGDTSIVIGAVTWLVILGASVGGWLIRRRRGHRPQRTAEDVWNQTDPEYKKRSWNWWQWPWGGGGTGP